MATADFSPAKSSSAWPSKSSRLSASKSSAALTTARGSLSGTDTAMTSVTLHHFEEQQQQCQPSEADHNSSDSSGDDDTSVNDEDDGNNSSGNDSSRSYSREEAIVEQLEQEQARIRLQNRLRAGKWSWWSCKRWWRSCIQWWHQNVQQPTLEGQHMLLSTAGNNNPTVHQLHAGAEGYQSDRPRRAYQLVAMFHNGLLNSVRFIWWLVSFGTQWLFTVLCNIIAMCCDVCLMTLSLALFFSLWPWNNRGNVRRMFRFGINRSSWVSLILFGQSFLIVVALFGYGLYATITIHRPPCVSSDQEARATYMTVSCFPSLSAKRVGDIWQSSRSKIVEIPRMLKDLGLPKIPSLDHWMPLQTRQKGSNSYRRILIPEEALHSIEDLESRLEWIQRTLQDLEVADESLHKDFDSKLDTVTHRISEVEGRLSTVGNDVGFLKHYISSGEWIDRIVLNVLKKETPQYVAVSLDPSTGEVRVPAAFWNRARELFVAREELNEVLDDRKGLRGSGSIDWVDFLNENERALHQLVDGRITMLSQREFLRLVKNEANAIWASLQTRVVELLDRERRPRVTAGTQFYTSLGSWMSQEPVASTRPTSRSLSEVETQVITDLIDQALERYSADVIAKPDYALHNAGGRIIPDLTSPDYHPVSSKPTWLGRLVLTRFFPEPIAPATVVSSSKASLRSLKSAVKAIQPDMHIGECWAMNGTQGQIGIRLTRRIVVTEVTIEHVDPRVAYDMRSAPKEMEIWRLISPVEAKQQFPAAPASSLLAPSQEEQTQHTRAVESDDAAELPSPVDQVEEATTAEEKEQVKENQSLPSSNSPIKGTWVKKGSPSPGATLLTTIVYQARLQGQDDHMDTDQGHHQSGHKLIQTFPIPLSKQNVPAIGVVVRINSNWGWSEFTCLYRVRVHGYELTASEAAESS